MMMMSLVNNGLTRVWTLVCTVQHFCRVRITTMFFFLPKNLLCSSNSTAYSPGLELSRLTACMHTHARVLRKHTTRTRKQTPHALLKRNAAAGRGVMRACIHCARMHVCVYFRQHLGNLGGAVKPVLHGGLAAAARTDDDCQESGMKARCTNDRLHILICVNTHRKTDGFGSGPTRLLIHKLAPSLKSAL